MGIPLESVPTNRRASPDLAATWTFTRGRGQTVAVIDTGVNPHARLPSVAPGGDYVSTGDGRSDCDVHGTIVAGIIGASPGPDGFSGIAPDARILSIRQSSDRFQNVSPTGEPDDRTAGVGSLATLAAAVVRAADLGATVINISLVACSTHQFDDRVLGAALRYAVDTKDVVIVAAAGNSDRCPDANADLVTASSEQDRWSRVRTLVSPAWYDDYVITVGSATDTGTPSQFSVAGPWVDIAANGENAVSLDPSGSGLARGRRTDESVSAFNGTSFAAPVVAGVAALVRARYPDLTARQVRARLIATAQRSGPNWHPQLGHGLVDPYAAVTTVLSPASSQTATMSAALPTNPVPPNTRNDANSRSWWIAAAIATVAVLFGAGYPSRNPRRARTELG